MANYLDVPAASGAHTPSQAGLAAGTTTIDLRAELAPTAWSGANQVLISQDSNTAADERFWWGILISGVLEYFFYNNLGAAASADSTTTTGFANGSSHGVRVLHNITAGTVDFYTSTDFSTWTPLGSQVTGLATAGQQTTGTAAAVTIGTDAFAEDTPGRITRTMVLINGATILNMDWTLATPGAGPWTATSGETWTADGTATVILGPATVTPQAGLNFLRMGDRRS